MFYSHEAYSLREKTSKQIYSYNLWSVYERSKLGLIMETNKAVETYLNWGDGGREGQTIFKPRPEEWRANHAKRQKGKRQARALCV